MLIILLGISLIPSLYTVLFLSSMWDPYGKLAELPVAVVNQDKAVTYNEEKLAIGDSLVAGLQESKSLDFDFVSQAAAEAGLAKQTRLRQKYRLNHNHGIPISLIHATIPLVHFLFLHIQLFHT